MTKKEVEFGWAQALAIDPDKKHSVCLLTAPWSLLDREARSFAINEFKTWPQVAVIVHNLGQKLMGNFALKLSGNSRNIRIFECPLQAKAWLVS